MQYLITSYKDTFPCKNFRLEAEFYVSKVFSGIDYFFGEDIIDFVQYGTSKALNEESNGYPTLRLNEFEGGFIASPSKYCNLITDETYQSLRLIKDDVLICRTNGNPKLVGKSAIVMEDTKFAFASYLYRIRPNKSKVLSAYLTIYLNSKIGRREIEKYSMHSNQVNFSPAKFREIAIPVLSLPFQEQIVNLVKSSYYNVKQTKSIYHQAQTLLLSEISLLDWKPNHHLSFVKNYSDTQQAGRFDAEYYQPKYDEIVAAIKSYAGGWDTTENILNIKDKNFSPKEKVEYKYIELANIGSNGEINGFMEAEGQDLPTRARRKVTKNDVIVSSIEGSLSSIALIPDEYDGALCSTGFYVVKSDKINPQTLLVLLKSPLGQEQLKKGCSGTILTATNKDEIGNIVLPLVNNEIQNKIQQKVTEYFYLRKQSKHLLECAKKAVEMAIENDENSAMEWLKSQIDSK